MAKEESGGTGVVLEASRREKLRKIIEMGIDPWGGRFDGQMSIGSVRAREGEIVVGEPVAPPPPPEGQQQWRKPEIPMSGPTVRVAGRIILQRRQGKLIFLTIRDWTGQIQILIGKNQVGEENWNLALCFDLGDLVGIDGEFKKTQKGELTVVFTQKGETADHYIERLCDEYASSVSMGKMELRVATSDGTEQTVVFGRGAVRISSRELIYEIGQARKSGQPFARPVSRSSSKSMVIEHLPPDVREKLEKMRRSGK